MLLVVLLPVLATLLTPKPKADLELESLDTLMVVVVEVVVVVEEATTEVAVARPANRGAAGAAAAVTAVVGLKEKGADKGTATGGPRSPKVGLKVEVAVLVIVGSLARLDGKGPSLSLLGAIAKIGFKVGEAEDMARAPGEEGSEVSLFDMPPNSTPCMGEGVDVSA